MRQLCVCRDIEHLGSFESTQEARVALGCASCNSYASFVVSKLPACSICRHTHAGAWTNCYIYDVYIREENINRQLTWSNIVLVSSKSEVLTFGEECRLISRTVACNRVLQLCWSVWHCLLSPYGPLHVVFPCDRVISRNIKEIASFS